MGGKFIIRPDDTLRERLNGDDYVELETWLRGRVAQGHSLDSCYFSFVKKLGKILQGSDPEPSRSAAVVAMNFVCKRARFVFTPPIDVCLTDFGILRDVWFDFVDEAGETENYSSSGSSSEEPLGDWSTDKPGKACVL